MSKHSPSGAHSYQKNRHHTENKRFHNTHHNISHSNYTNCNCKPNRRKILKRKYRIKPEHKYNPYNDVDIAPIRRIHHKTKSKKQKKSFILRIVAELKEKYRNLWISNWIESVKLLVI